MIFIDRISSIINAQHFYEPVHSRIYEVASNAHRQECNLASSGDAQSVSWRMTKGSRNLAAQPIWPGLAGAAISCFCGARDYAQMIYDLAIRRELIGLGQRNLG